MSTIRVDNFAPSAGGTAFGIEGIAKAWGRFDATGTPAFDISENMSSIEDVATGTYRLHFVNAFLSREAYGGTAMSQVASSSNPQCVRFTSSSSTDVVYINREGASASTVDTNENVGVIHGDLA